MNHISQLKSQVEDLKLGGEHRYETEQVQELQKLLQQEREAGEMREKEVRIVVHLHSFYVAHLIVVFLLIVLVASIPKSALGFAEDFVPFTL